MILIKKTEIVGWEPAIRGMRNALNSWEKSDSIFHIERMVEPYSPGGVCYIGKNICGKSDIVKPPCTSTYKIGPNDLDLMLRLAKAGSADAKYRRMIVVYTDITLPLYLIPELDSYKVGTVSNSCSKMHTLHKRDLTLKDFSVEHLDEEDIDYLEGTIDEINRNRESFVLTKDKKYWWKMIQLLPDSFNQKRTMMLNYEVLANIYKSRRNHKLDEWRDFCRWIEGLPYSEIITCNAKQEDYNEEK